MSYVENIQEKVENSPFIVNQARRALEISIEGNMSILKVDKNSIMESFLEKIKENLLG